MTGFKNERWDKGFEKTTVEVVCNQDLFRPSVVVRLPQIVRRRRCSFKQWAPPPLLCCIWGHRTASVWREEQGVRSRSPTCVYECGNKALLSLPLNTPVSTPLPLTSLFQQGPLCGAWSFSCCVSLSWTVRQNALSIVLLRLTFKFGRFYPKHVELKAFSEDTGLSKTPNWFSFSTQARVWILFSS